MGAQVERNVLYCNKIALAGSSEGLVNISKDTKYLAWRLIETCSHLGGQHHIIDR